MGKIRTEGIGEVQEFVDIVSGKVRAGTQLSTNQPMVIVIRIGNNGGNTSIYAHSVTMGLVFRE